MLAIMGHMSRAMLERYSHIRMAAKRIAVGVAQHRRWPRPKDSDKGSLKNPAKVESKTHSCNSL